MKAIIAEFANGATVCETKPVYQYDHGRKMIITGTDIESPVEVHFAGTDRGGEAIVRTATYNNGVLSVNVPDAVLRGFGGRRDYNMHAYIYVEDGDTGATTYHITTPVKTRPRPVEDIPDAQEKTALQEAIEALQHMPGIDVAETETGYSVTVTQADGTSETVHLTNGAKGDKGDAGADGADGISPTIQTVEVTGGTQVIIMDASGAHTFVIYDGAKGARGADGAKGDKGDKGDSGADGADGADGKSAYEIACDTGAYMGTYNYNGRDYTLRDMTTADVTARIQAGGEFTRSTSTTINAGDVLLLRDSRTNTPYVVGTVLSYDTANKKIIFDNSESYYVGTYTGQTDGALIAASNIPGKRTEADWVASLHGTNGTNGQDGENGLSAYEMACNYGWCGDGVVVLNIAYAVSKRDAEDAIQNDTPIEINSSGADVIINVTPIMARGNDYAVVGFGTVAETGGDYCLTVDSTADYAVVDIYDYDKTNADIVADASVLDFPDTSEEAWLASLQGADGTDGTDGHTPVKGTDYWTVQDQADIVADVLAALNSADTTSY